MAMTGKTSPPATRGGMTAKTNSAGPRTAAGFHLPAPESDGFAGMKTKAYTNEAQTRSAIEKAINEIIARLTKGGL